MFVRQPFIKLTLIVSIGLFIYLAQFSKFHHNFFHQTSSGTLSSQSHSNYQNIRKKSYLVNTSKCQIIDWPTFDEQVLPLYKNKSGLKIKCNYKSKYDIRIERYNFTGIIIENNSQLKCYSSAISRWNGDDKKAKFSTLEEIKNNITYFPNEIAVRISCGKNKDKKQLEKVIPLIPEKEPKNFTDKNIPNILVVGVDSTSRINFDRHFPMTSKLLMKHNFYTMYGYNKVADNTFVNLTPLLTGHYVEDIWRENMTKRYFDYFPFIWKEFENAGHQTLLFEDAPNMATFNYLRKGFSKPPTTYYLRPYNIVVDKKTDKDCYLDEPEVEIYYKYLYDFVKAMNTRNQSYFAFHFMARLTHDDLNKAGFLDPIIEKLFERFFDENLLSNTILIFFSDHGLRFGPIRETLSGKLEERLPFMHLYLPNKWRNNYLKINENRLTTPFDIHATLMHIIRGQPNYDLLYGKTLFEEIPENRSCSSISLPEHWCSCQSSQPIHDLKLVNPISEFIVENVNRILSEKYSVNCTHLVLSKTISASEQHLSDKVLNFEKKTDSILDGKLVYKNKSFHEIIKNYMITIKVKPSDALFEATVKLNKTSGQMLLMGEVSRINLYGNQSNCINDAFLRKYCFCKNLL